MEALSSQSSVNRYYDTTVRGLVAESEKQMSDVKQPEQEQGWFGWIWGGGQAPKDELSIKQAQIKNLEAKLGALEQKATEAEVLGANAKGGSQILYQQQMLAIKELMVEVKLSIAEGLLEEHALKFGKNSEKYKGMEVKVNEFKERIHTEGRELLHQEAVFWGLRKIYDEIQERRGVDTRHDYKVIGEDELPSFLELMNPSVAEEETVKYPHSVGDSRAAIVNELNLESIHPFSESLSDLEKHEFEVEKLSSEVDRLATAIERNGHIKETGIALSSAEIGQMKVDLLEEKIKLRNAEKTLMNAQVTHFAHNLNHLTAELDQQVQILNEMNQLYAPEDEEGVREHFQGVDRPTQSRTIKELKDQIAAIESDSAILKRKLEAIPKQIRNLQMEVVAQKDVNQVAAGQDSGMLARGMQAGMNAMANLMPGPGLEAVTYKWEQSEWGKLIADEREGVLYNQFRSNVNSLKTNIKRYEAQLTIQRSELHRLQDRVAQHHYIDPAVLDAEGMEDTIKLENDWKNQISALQSRIESTQATLDDTKVALHGAFLQRVIKSTSDRQVAKKTEKAHLHAIQDQISSIEAKRNSPERINSDQELNFLDGEAKKQRLDWMVKEENTYQSLCRQAKESQNMIDQYKAELDALDVGFRTQMNKYGTVERGKRGIIASAGQYATDVIKESVSLGLIRTRYVTPHEFEVEMMFARAGYTISEGLKGFTEQVEGGGQVAFLKAQTEHFLKFMDNHPIMGKFMVTDLAIALAGMQDQTPYNTLLSGLRARGYTQAILGSLGRNVEVPPVLNKETAKQAFKWKALADLASGAPQAVHIGKGLVNAAAGAISMNPGAVFGALANGVAGAAGATAIQKVAKDLPDEAVAISIGAMRALRGDDPIAICDEQKNLALLTLAGEVRRGISSPQRALLGIRRILSDNWSAFRQAGALEKIARIGMSVGPPVVGVGAAAAVIALAGPLGLGIAAVAAVAVTAVFIGVTAGILLTGISNRLPGFRSSLTKARTAEARKAARSGDAPKQMRIQRDQYIGSLRTRGKLLQAPQRIGELPLLTKWRDGQNGVIDTVEQSVVANLERSLTTAQTTRGLQGLTTNEIKNIFLAQAGPDELRRLVNEKIEANPEAKALPQKAKDKLRDGMMASVQERVVNSWLKPQLDVGFENELVSSILNYESPEQFAAAKQQVARRLEDKQRKISADIDQQVRDELGPANHAHADFVAQNLKQQFDLNAPVGAVAA